MLPGVPLIGTGGLGSRVWSGPAITVTGIDVPSVDERAQRRVAVRARAKLNLRVHPEQDAVEAQAALVRAPRGAAAVRHRARRCTRARPATGSPPRTTGPAYEAAREAMAAAWGSAPVSAAGGGSIPLVNALQAAAPEAEILLVGATDGYANIHAPDERVLLDELEKAVVAEADVLRPLRRALA